MSQATNAFCARMREKRDHPTFTYPKVTAQGQTAFMRDCPDCQLMAPHILVDGGSQCGICGKVTLRERIDNAG